MNNHPSTTAAQKSAIMLGGVGQTHRRCLIICQTTIPGLRSELLGGQQRGVTAHPKLLLGALSYVDRSVVLDEA
jgi:hypothetical protein